LTTFQKQGEEIKHPVFKTIGKSSIFETTMQGIATLGQGSALGSSIANVILAAAYLKSRSPNAVLQVNVHSASAQAKLFLDEFYFAKDLFEIVDKPTGIPELGSAELQDNRHHLPYTLHSEGEELFFRSVTENFKWDNEYFSLTSEIAKQLWARINYKPEVSDFNICAHIRRGDKLVYEQYNRVHLVSDYIEYIENHFQNPGNVCIVTDDYRTFVEFRDLRKGWNVTTTCVPESLGFDINQMNGSPTETVRTEIRKMLLDYEIIIKSKVFIGTHSSNVAVIAKLLRTNGITHIFGK
jgi:hypothetical protein